ncbi:MAG: shikimate dehydrogenase family protein [Chitinophagales bacterium]|jgi:shikimate dehydrogenase|nr:shikimate dehydrogenase [Sphingobacteriales bacterium]
MKLALIGKSLSHSFSKSYFTSKFQRENIEASYDNFEFNSEEDLINSWPEIKNQFDGFNLTIPYKKTLVDQIDELDIHAKKIGAINCIAIRAGKGYGYNTDFQGFYKSVFKKSFSRNRKALILGNGGASLAVNYAIENLLKMPVDIISRDRKDLDWSDIETINLGEYSLIVNTTPLGMHPDIDTYPALDYRSAQHDTLFVDLIYNPMITKFLEKADEQGCMILNGLPMLHNQADLSWEIWNNLLC